MKNHPIATGSGSISEKQSTPSLIRNSIPGFFGTRFFHARSKGEGVKTGYTVLIWLMIFTLSSCKKDVIDVLVTENLPSTARDIYIAGYHNGNIVYWKNGVEHVLCASEWTTGDALGIAVSGNDVYVVGKRNNNAVFWKNGIEVPLTTDTTGTEEATAIAINGDDIYITGNEAYGNNGSYAVYWKNGVKTILAHDPDNGNLITTRDIAITGNDMYISGVIKHTAVYWKNGAKTALSPETSAAFRMAVSGTDIYVCGKEGGSPVFWKNGLKTALGAASGCAYDISASGEDVYIVGVENTLPVIWKNQVKTTLGREFSDGMALGNCGVDTYVVGTIFNRLGCTAACWTNGLKTDLSLVPTSQGGVAKANSIVVVNH